MAESDGSTGRGETAMCPLGHASMLYQNGVALSSLLVQRHEPPQEMR